MDDLLVLCNDGAGNPEMNACLAGSYRSDDANSPYDEAHPLVASDVGRLGHYFTADEIEVFAV